MPGLPTARPQECVLLGALLGDPPTKGLLALPILHTSFDACVALPELATLLLAGQLSSNLLRQE